MPSENWNRKEYIQIAKDLLYPRSVIDSLMKAKTESDAIRIMATARENAIKNKQGWQYEDSGNNSRNSSNNRKRYNLSQLYPKKKTDVHRGDKNSK